MKKKEKLNYFNEFITITEYIVKSAGMLKEILSNYDLEKLDEDISSVHRLENKSDHIVHSIRSNLIKDFLPPIDREDIAVICKKLDNIEDGIDEILIFFKILDIKVIKQDVHEIVEVLFNCCNAVNDMFLNLNNFKDVELINKKVIQINRLEEQGDRIYEKITSSLYRECKDSIDIIKWTRIYNCLEDTIDICEEVSDCIADTVMKNS